MLSSLTASAGNDGKGIPSSPGKKLSPFVTPNHSQYSMHYLFCNVQDSKLAIAISGMLKNKILTQDK